MQKELAFIVEKHKNGEDAICYLTDLASNYSGYLKYKIMSEICSYTILFTNNFKVGVEQFITLIEQPEIMNSSLITVSILYSNIFKFLFHQYHTTTTL